MWLTEHTLSIKPWRVINNSLQMWPKTNIADYKNMFWVLITRLLNCFNNMKEYSWQSCFIQTHCRNSTRQTDLYILLCCLSYVFEIIITYYFWTDKNWSLKLIHIFQFIFQFIPFPSHSWWQPWDYLNEFMSMLVYFCGRIYFR